MQFKLILGMGTALASSSIGLAMPSNSYPYQQYQRYPSYPGPNSPTYFSPSRSNNLYQLNQPLMRNNSGFNSPRRPASRGYGHSSGSYFGFD